MNKYKITLLILFLIILFSVNQVNAYVNDFPLLGKTIYLDAGHGGKDPGAIYDNVYEKDINLDIVKMNGYEYLRENNFEHYYESRTIPLYPIEKLEYYRVAEKIRKVWKVKLEFEKNKDLSYQEDSFTYFVDTTTGEIVGGE